jgi:hypothetical protein
MAATTPGLASGMRVTSTSEGQVANSSHLRDTLAKSTTPNLFDPSHIPTLFQRIHSISQLLIEASNDPDSLSIPKEQQQPGLRTQGNGNDYNADLKSSSNLSVAAAAPGIVMGSTTEDDVNSGYEAALALSLEGGAQQENIKGTELAHKIVKESQGLRDAFQRAKEAVNNLEGGNMDIEEQERLIHLLQSYSQEQR